MPKYLVSWAIGRPIDVYCVLVLFMDVYAHISVSPCMSDFICASVCMYLCICESIVYMRICCVLAYMRECFYC